MGEIVDSGWRVGGKVGGDLRDRRDRNRDKEEK